MKPTPQFTTKNRRDLSPAARQGFASPLTDYNFRSPITDFPGGCSGGRGPSFRGISNDYFKREARGHFAAEAALFALIIFTAAIPVVQGVRSALELVRVTGVL